MSLIFLVQANYGAAGSEVLDCELPRYLAALLRVANVHDVSVAERNVAAATAYVLADEEVRQEAFRYSFEAPPSWDELLQPLRSPKVAVSLFRDACQVAWSDGELDADEEGVLSEVARALHLEDSRRDAVLHWVKTQELARLELLQLLGGA